MFTGFVVEPPTELTLLQGRYGHIRELGRGSSGRVVLARDEVNGSLRALKMVPPEARDRLVWELELLRAVVHPNLAGVHELLVVDEAVGVPFHLPPGSGVLIEDFVEGRRAGRALDGSSGHARWVSALRALDDVTSALLAMHDAGLLHGDVKPDNVLVRPDGSATLVDMGLAGPPVAADGRLRGTLAYLAPEAWTGTRSIATDLFSVGATLVRLLGAPVEDRPTGVGGLPRPITPADLPADVPSAIRALSTSLLAVDSADRPDDAREALARIREARRLLGEALPTAPLPEPSPKARALAARHVPRVGDRRPLALLAEAIAQGRAVRVAGPEGSGRSRSIREAVAQVQREAAASGRRVPTYVPREIPTTPPDDACVLHCSAPVDEDWIAREQRAAAVAGRFLAIVIEGEDQSTSDVTLRPLPAEGVDALLVALVGWCDMALRRAAMEVSGGLAGRLCRVVADAYAAGQDPSRPEVLARAERSGSVSEDLVGEVDRLAIAGGSLPYADIDISPEHARRLTAAGLAWVQDGRWTLRRDLVRRRRGSALEGVPIVTHDARASAYLAAAAGEDAAVRSFEGVIDRSLEAGALVEAEQMAEDGVELTGATSLALRLAEVRRAAGRYDDALKALAEHEGAEVAAVRAEIARRAGNRELASRALEDAQGASAEITRAWLALADPEGPAPNDEIRAWKALLAGDVDAAEGHARRGLASRGTRRGERQARARLHATLGSVLQAKGDLAGAAHEHQRAGHLAEALGERHLAATSLANLGAVQLDRGALGEGRHALLEGSRELLRLGRDRDAARALANLASVSLWIGDPEAAHRACEQAEAAAVRAADPEASAIVWLLHLELALRGGDVTGAFAIAERAPGAESRTAALVRTRAAGLLARHDVERAAALRDPGAHAFEVRLADARLELARGQRASLEDVPVADTWERRLALALVKVDAADALGDAIQAELAGAQARQLLDEAAHTLTPPQRRRLRRVPAHQRVLAHRPAEAASPSTDRWRRLAAQAKRLTAERSVSRLREEVVDAAVELVDAERGFWVERTEGGELEIRAAHAWDLGDVSVSRSVVARALDGRRPIRAMDALEDERLRAAGSVHAIALRSVLCVPLRWRGRDAALYVDDRLRPAAFDEEDGALLGDLASLAAIAVQGAERLRAERTAVQHLEQVRRRLADEVEAQRAELATLRQRAPSVVAASEPMRRTMELAARVAGSDVPVLVLGESGSGKERVARAIHAMSGRRDRPFVAESCGAISDTLLESALFGHERGAFTGAGDTRRGLFELADGGTLLLDEIGEMSPAMQSKLLRVVQEGELRRVGGERTQRVDVRLLAATHRDLKAMVAEGTFREDLFYRLAVVTVEVPPLRERPADVPGLVQTMLDDHARDRGRRVTITKPALDALARAPWPGNVRELHNVLQRALVMAESEIDVHDLSLGGGSQTSLELKDRLESLERELVAEAMRRCDGNQTRAAELLGVSRYGLQKKLTRLGLR